MKKNIKLLSNIASVIILSATLIISVSYGWYTINSEVNSSGIASAESNVISVLQQGIYKKEIGDNPFPENDKKTEIEGILSGDIVYFSVSVGLAEKTQEAVNYDLNIKVVNIDGGEYFIEQAKQIVSKPAGTTSGKTYVFDEREFDVYVYENNEYFIYEDQGNEYIYYLYESASGEILTRNPILIFANPNGTKTSNKITYNGNEYETYLDSNGKEYFLTEEKTIIDEEEFVNATYVNYIYEQTVDGEKVRYNMCDVYTLGIYKIFGMDKQGNYVVIEDNSHNLNLLSIEKENRLDKEVKWFNLLDYENWNPNEFEQIVFTFAIKFDYSWLENEININCVSAKELILTKIIITETESGGEE